MARLFDLFLSFAKIGTFTIGGGYAMIPLMEREIVDKYNWMTRDEFLDAISVSQAMPGVFAANMATTVGYRLRGITGAVASVLGNILAPILFILALAAFFCYFKGNRLLDAIFMGIRPAVVALIAAPVFSMAKTANISWKNLWIPLLSAGLIWLFGVSPVFIILVAACAGYFWGCFNAKGETK